MLSILMPCINNLYLFCIEKTREHVSLHLQQAKRQLRANYSIRWNVVLSQDICIPEKLFATHSGGQRANHTAMTRPSKMDWHQVISIIHISYIFLKYIYCKFIGSSRCLYSVTIHEWQLQATHVVSTTSVIYIGHRSTPTALPSALIWQSADASFLANNCDAFRCKPCCQWVIVLAECDFH